MATAGLNIQATAHVKITKLDENDKVIEVCEHNTQLTREEAERLWLSQQQA